MQEIALFVTLAVVAVIAAVFVRVALLSRQREDYMRVQGSAYGFRALLFWVLIIAGIGIAWLTLRELPYSAHARTDAPQIINATGYQWYWEFDRYEVIAGQPVEFRVGAADVNHGFGIYDADLRLVVQVQAMPGYVNRLVHTFDQPGTYQILCLEYCGVAHHGMVDEIEVIAAADIVDIAAIAAGNAGAATD